MRLPNDEILHYKSDDGVSVVVERTELVRCKNCIHNGSFDTDCPFGWRDERFNLPDDIDFCSYGERNEQEHEDIR